MKWEREHQEPRSRGGVNGADNIVLACHPCNHEKDDMDVETYRVYLQDKLPAGARVIFYGERITEQDFYGRELIRDG